MSVTVRPGAHYPSSPGGHMTTNHTRGEQARLIKGGLPDSPDPVEVAMAAAADDPQAQSIVRSMLSKQDRLFDAQISQLGRQRWRDGFFALVAGCVAIAAATFVWSAWQADGIVVTPFAVPPALEQRGLTGAVVASQMLDQLTAMQAETTTVRPASSYGDDWSNNIKVDLPYAGVSIGELRRFFITWLGKQRTLSGEVVSTPKGDLAVTARITGSSGRRYEGQNLDVLLGKAAEGVYRDTQAYRYAAWLKVKMRDEEALVISQELARSKDPTERMWGLYSLALRTADDRQKIAIYRRGMEMDPTFPGFTANIGYAELGLGHSEAGCGGIDQSLQLYEPWRDRMAAGSVDGNILNGRSVVAGCRGDFQQVAKLQRQASENALDFINTTAVPIVLARTFARLHDPQSVRQIMAEAGLNDPANVARMLAILGPEAEPQLIYAEAARDWPAVRDHLAARLAPALPAKAGKPSTPIQSLDLADQSQLAEAQARTGQAMAAAATINATPLDCDYCVRVRGLAAAFAGRPAEADRWFTMLAKRTPTLPMAAEAWAEALLLRGDYNGAARKAAAAHALGPRWAEPLKQWGDALAAQGQWAGARDKYKQALERAPNWQALRAQHGAAARRS